MTFLSRAKALLMGEYAFFRILELQSPVTDQQGTYHCAELTDISELQRVSHQDLRPLVVYEGTEAHCFVAREATEIVGVCWYWFGATYRRRNFWPLGEKQAKLVQITTAESHRGRGVAEQLIRWSSMAMFRKGFGPLYARVWHSHAASLRAFEKAGWTETALVIEVFPFGRKARFVRRRNPSRGRELTG